MAPSLKDTFWGLVFPWIFMCHSLSYLPGTILRLARSGALLSALFSPSAFKEAWFSDFWAWAGPNVRNTATPRVVPLLHGRVSGGRAVGEDHKAPHPSVSGTVLEIGPGSGMWVHMFGSGALGKDAAKIQRVLGVEPNREVHGPLKAAAARAGLADVYEVVPAGIESLAKSGAVERGEVDCIVSILCLCSIPDPERNIRELFSFLKPGGRWYVYEHVRCSNCRPIVWYQAFINIFWPRLIGGCRLRNETGKWLVSAGPWADVDLTQPPEEPWYACVPHVLGILTK